MLVEVVRSLSISDFLGQVLEVVRRSRNSAGDVQQSPNLRRDFGIDVLSIGASQIVLFGLFAMIDWRLYFLLWAVPIMTTMVLIGKLRSAVEHAPLERDRGAVEGSPYFGSTRGPVLRSVDARAWERLFLSKINGHYHAEHHLWPHLSYQKLPRVARLVVNSGVSGIVHDRSYMAVLYKLAIGR
jgi:fatty acid desaturase